MKKYRNESNHHLQFFYARLELAPGQELSVEDDVVKEDPGSQACLEKGLIVEVGGRRRGRKSGKAAADADTRTSDSPTSSEPSKPAPATQSGGMKRQSKLEMQGDAATDANPAEPDEKKE